MKIILRLGSLVGNYGESKNPPLFYHVIIPKNLTYLIAPKETQEPEYINLVFERKKILNDVAYYDYVFVIEEKEVKKWKHLKRIRNI